MTNEPVSLAKLTLALFAALALTNVSAQTTDRSASDQDSERCKVLRWDSSRFAQPYLPINQPGKYCLDRDYRLSCSEWLGTCGSSDFIEIDANDVDLDLRGHALHRSGRPLAVLAIGKNITIRNGVIQDGNVLVTMPSPPDGPVNGDAPWVEPEFDNDNEFVVENMTFIGAGTITIVGANAIVRNNKVAGNRESLAPIIVYGPRPLIENNEIKRRTGGQDSKFQNYGIYLRFANGAVVRRNILENVGRRDNSFAIGLRKSEAVTIEANTITNFGETIQRIGKSDEHMKSNVIR